jgi:hypothetical protein
MLPKDQIRVILKEAGESTISTSARTIDGITISTGDTLREAQMGGFDIRTWEVVGFVSAKALFIHDNEPRWREDWKQFGSEHANDIGVVLKLRHSGSDRYDIRNLASIAPTIERQRQDGLSPVTPLG